MTRTEAADPDGRRAAAIWAVVPAAGSGTRMARGHEAPERPKQYLELAGRTLLERALATLLDVPGLGGVVVALAPHDARWEGLAIASDPRVHRARGAATRAASVAAGLARLGELAPPDAWVLVHDAARPLTSGADIARLLGAVLDGGATGGLLAVPVHDTLKRAGSDHRVEATVPRERLWRAQTPQLFRLAELAGALDAAARGGATITDEASAMELAGHEPQLVEALDPNPKITRAGDLDTAEAIVRERERRTCA